MIMKHKKCIWKSKPTQNIKIMTWDIWCYAMLCQHSASFVVIQRVQLISIDIPPAKKTGPSNEFTAHPIWSWGKNSASYFCRYYFRRTLEEKEERRFFGLLGVFRGFFRKSQKFSYPQFSEIFRTPQIFQKIFVPTF